MFRFFCGPCLCPHRGITTLIKYYFCFVLFFSLMVWADYVIPLLHMISTLLWTCINTRSRDSSSSSHTSVGELPSLLLLFFFFTLKVSEQKKLPTPSFYVHPSLTYSNRQMVNMKLTADNYVIQYLRKHSQHIFLLNSCPGLEMKSL